MLVLKLTGCSKITFLGFNIDLLGLIKCTYNTGYHKFRSSNLKYCRML